MRNSSYVFQLGQANNTKFEEAVDPGNELT